MEEIQCLILIRHSSQLDVPQNIENKKYTVKDTKKKKNVTEKSIRLPRVTMLRLHHLGPIHSFYRQEIFIAITLARLRPCY